MTETIHQIKTTSITDNPAEGLRSSEELHFLHRSLRARKDVVPATIEIDGKGELVVRLRLQEPEYQAKVNGEKLEIDRRKPEIERSFSLTSKKPIEIEYTSPEDGTKNKLIIELQKQINLEDTEFEKLSAAGASFNERIAPEPTTLISREKVGFDEFSAEEESKLRNILKGTFKEARLIDSDKVGLAIYGEEINLRPSILCIDYKFAQNLIEFYEKGYVEAVRFALNHEKGHQVYPSLEILAKRQELREYLLKKGITPNDAYKMQFEAEDVHKEFLKRKGINSDGDLFFSIYGEVHAQLYALNKAKDPEKDYITFLALLYASGKLYPDGAKNLKEFIEQHALGHLAAEMYFSRPFIDGLENKVGKRLEEMGYS